jgi:hypothetical protein
VTRVVCDSKQAVPIRATSASFVVVRAAVYRLTRSRETPRISQSHYGMAVLWSPHSTPGRYPAERGWGWSGRVSPLRRTPRWRWPVRWRCWESLPRQPTPDPSDPAGSHPIWEGSRHRGTRRRSARSRTIATSSSTCPASRRGETAIVGGGSRPNSVQRIRSLDRTIRQASTDGDAGSPTSRYRLEPNQQNWERLAGLIRYSLRAG